MSYTPGPWHYAEDFTITAHIMPYLIWCDKESIYFPCSEANTPEDAQLISAAPDLLEALEGLMEAETYCSGEGPAWDKAKTAIRKARGEK